MKAKTEVTYENESGSTIADDRADIGAVITLEDLDAAIDDTIAKFPTTLDYLGR